jgi:tight adherence protein B
MIAAATALAVVAAAMALRPRRHRLEPATSTEPRRLDAFVAAWSARRARRRVPDARAVASWCDDIVRQLRSGSTLRDALGRAPDDTTTALATAQLRVAIERGLSIPDAIARVDDTGPHLRLALGVLSTTSRIGGPAAASIDRTAMTLRRRAADLDDRSTQAAQARLSTHVMTAVPLLMLAVLVTTDHDVRAVSVSPIGAACITSGLILNLAGWWWMHRIVGAST